MPSRKHLHRPSVGSPDRWAVRDRRGDMTCFIAPQVGSWQWRSWRWAWRPGPYGTSRPAHHRAPRTHIPGCCGQQLAPWGPPDKRVRLIDAGERARDLYGRAPPSPTVRSASSRTPPCPSSPPAPDPPTTTIDEAGPARRTAASRPVLTGLPRQCEYFFTHSILGGVTPMRLSQEMPPSPRQSPARRVTVGVGSVRFGGAAAGRCRSVFVH